MQQNKLDTLINAVMLIAIGVLVAFAISMTAVAGLNGCAKEQ